MRYLGRVSGTGTLDEPEDASPAKFEFECYLGRGDIVTVSGEIEAKPEALARMFGRRHVAFVTDKGAHLQLTLADSKKAPEGGLAEVVATGEIPVMRGGALSWETPAARAPETPAAQA